LSNVQASAFDRIAQQVHPRFAACGYIFLHSTRRLFSCVMRTKTAGAKVSK